MTPAVLTTSEAHKYVGKRTFFEWLVKRYQLTPVYIGPGHKTVLWSREQLDSAIRQLELDGGYDCVTGAKVAYTEPAEQEEQLQTA
jgi:hypothetical protein